MQEDKEGTENVVSEYGIESFQEGLVKFDRKQKREREAPHQKLLVGIRNTRKTKLI